MKLAYLLYGFLAGLTPLIIGLMAASVDPHGAAAQLPWFTMVTLPAGMIIGFLLSLFAV